VIEAPVAVSSEEARDAEIVQPDPEPDRAEPTGAIVPADPLRRYLAEIRAYPRLTRGEENELAIRFLEKGDQAAAQRLATSSLRLVVRIAMDYRRSYLNLLDLIQEGNIGLLQGIRKYDPYRGVPFSAYAGYWIRAYLLKYLLDHWSLVRVGTTNVRRKLFYNLRREQEWLRSRGIEAGPKLLAQNLGADESDVIEVSRALKGRDVSIDQPVGHPGEDQDRAVWETLAAEIPGPEEQVARREMQEILKAKIAEFASKLKEKERFILESRLLSEEPLTLQQIGDRYGTTREAVRQQEEKLIRRLKEFLKAEIRDLKRFEVKID
jgi:RNA polymerase sigma-32 factor